MNWINVFGGNLMGLYPITLFHSSNVAMYCTAKPSLFKSGHMLKTATLLTKTPQEYTGESTGAPDKRSVTGMSASSIDFSCTWNENKKNDSEDVSSAYGNSGRNGVWDSFSFLCTESSIEAMYNLIPARRSTTTLGKKPSAVNKVDSLSKKSVDAQCFHLKTTFDAHQKLATLSSNKPRENGKIGRAHV